MFRYYSFGDAICFRFFLSFEDKALYDYAGANRTYAATLRAYFCPTKSSDISLR